MQSMSCRTHDHTNCTIAVPCQYHIAPHIFNHNSCFTTSFHVATQCIRFTLVLASNPHYRMLVFILVPTRVALVHFTDKWLPTWDALPSRNRQFKLHIILVLLLVHEHFISCFSFLCMYVFFLHSCMYVCLSLRKEKKKKIAYPLVLLLHETLTILCS